nr:extracellular solute-binding protein [Maliibacterium massiliense]
MKKHAKSLRWIALLLALVTLALPMTGCGKKKDTLVVYTGQDADYIDPYLESFRAKYPDIDLEIVRDAGGVMTAKILAEKNNPRADVIWELSIQNMLVLEKEGILEGYAPQGLERILPDFKDTEDPPMWVGVDAYMVALTVNTKELEEKGLPVPTSYQDLIDPKYKGMIMMPSPTSSATGLLIVSSIIDLMGEEEGWAYLRKLDENIISYTTSGSQPSKSAASGECVIGISYDARCIREKRSGAPVEVVFPDEGAGWELETNALVKKNDIKDSAKLFLDWAISDEAMDAYKEVYPMIAITTDVEIPPDYPEDPYKKLIKPNFEWMMENRDAILKIWQDDFEA